MIRVPWVVFGASLLLTGVATWALAETVSDRDQVRLDNAVRVTYDHVRARLERNVILLQGGSALFAASDSVTHDEFRAYMERIDLDRHFPGVQGVGLARWLTPGEVEGLTAHMRTEIPDFRIWGEPGQPLRSAIVYLEPMDARNRAALGYDMSTEPVRAAAMMRARDQAAPALSGRVTLKQEIDEDQQPGFLVYMPVYRDARVPAIVEERRASLWGFIYAPFRAGVLFRDVAEQIPGRRVSFRVYDGVGVAEDRLLFDSRPPTVPPADEALYRDTVAMEVAGHPWTLTMATLPAFDEASDRELIPLMVLLGVLVSFVLLFATRMQERSRIAAERSEAARTRFFAAMSHELRTPINAVVGYNDLLLSGAYGPLDARQEDGIQRSQKAARHLTELVNDVLDLSKLAAGKVEVDLIEVHPAALLEDLLTTLGPVADEHGCPLQLETSRARHPIQTDPRRVRQIILNLVSNATKFGAGKPVVIRAADHDGGVRIEVTDRGPGIAESDQRLIFEEFVQLDSADRTAGGTGLGLTISRRLAELLGGSLEVDSVPGSGSTFRLELPRRPRTRGGMAEAG
ncbi:MAG: CHASE domain-containing protein [Gemmatimonadota bacterium]